MKEISLSDAIDLEAKGYVAHFCCPDCFDKWHQQEVRTPPAQ